MPAFEIGQQVRVLTVEEAECAAGNIAHINEIGTVFNITCQLSINPDAGVITTGWVYTLQFNDETFEGHYHEWRLGNVPHTGDAA